MPKKEEGAGSSAVRRTRVVKPGAGTLAAMRVVCPLCYAAQGVRCTTTNGAKPLLHMHAVRFKLVNLKERKT